MGEYWAMTHLFYKRFTDDFEALSALDRSIPPKTWDCYSGYNVHYNGNDSNGGALYHGFYAHPKIIKLVKEINSSFKNIRIDVLLFKNFTFKTDVGFYKEGDEEKRLYGNIENIPNKFTYCLFTIKFNNEYSQKSKFVLTLALAQFLRGYNPELQCSLRANKIKRYYINGMLKAQSTQSYGDWLCLGTAQQRNCTRETFNKFDDIELMNKINQNISFYRSPSLSGFIGRIQNA